MIVTSTSRKRSYSKRTPKKNLSNLSAKFKEAGRVNRDAVHILKTSDGWSVKREGSQRATVVCRLQSEAIAQAKRLAYVKNIVVHRADGRISKHIPLSK